MTTADTLQSLPLAMPKSRAAEGARVAYADATKVAEKGLVVIHPSRLGTVEILSLPVEVLPDAGEACKMARVAFEVVPQVRIEEPTVVMPVPQITDEIAEVSKLIQQRRIQQRTAEKCVCVCARFPDTGTDQRGDQGDFSGAALGTHRGTD